MDKYYLSDKFDIKNEKGSSFAMFYDMFHKWNIFLRANIINIFKLHKHEYWLAFQIYQHSIDKIWSFFNHNNHWIAPFLKSSIHEFLEICQR